MSQAGVKSIYKENLFKGKVALVTGGGTGIGLRIAREFSKLGGKVVISGRRKEVLEESVERIRSAGGEAYAVPCNIRDEESVQNCFKETESLVGTINYLVNNAGGQFPAPAETVAGRGWNAVIETNLTGTFYMSREAFNTVFRKKGGVIVNILANMWNGFPMMAHTGAARAGVENLTKSLAVEWGRHGVRVNGVAPGVIHSSGLDSYDPETRKIALAAGCFNQAWRLGTEEEVSATVIFLLSPAAAFITGVTIRVDGGESIYSPICPPVENWKNLAYKDD